MISINVEKRFNALFDRLVPMEGKADSLAGELLRATSQIIYRYYNDGDCIGCGYGNITCNAAARFLSQKGSDRIRKIVMALQKDEDLFYDYEDYLDELAAVVIDWIEANPQLETEPTQDMWDWYDPNIDRDDEEEE